MAFSGDFSISQGVDVHSFIITDTSTGTDPALTGRTIAPYLPDGTYLGGSTIPWPLTDGSTKTLLNYLPRDHSINFLVTWQSSSPIPGSSYSKTHIVTFTGNSNAGAYGYLQQIAAQQAITNDQLFEENLTEINSDIQNAVRANGFGDQGNAEQCLNRIYTTLTNQQFYF